LNLPTKSSNDVSILKTTESSSPTRRVRFKFDENDKNGNIYSSDDIRFPKKYSIHRVEFQIPVRQGIIKQSSRIDFHFI
jgi:hypothetical protein